MGFSNGHSLRDTDLENAYFLLRTSRTIMTDNRSVMSTLSYSSASNIARDDVLAHLEQMLADRRFASAERNAKFLRHVVEGTLNGKASEIKETVIGTEVYGRPSGYDPKADSIVRVEANRLRQKLRSYYENEGKSATIRIHLPSGSYVPRFESQEEASRLETLTVEDTQIAAAAAPVVVPADDAVPTRWSALRNKRVVFGAGASVMVVLLSIQVARGSRTTDSQDAEGMAAWQEGVALMGLDPHTAQTMGGPPRTLLRAIERLEFAVTRNPMRAQTWASLAEAYDYASGYSGRDLTEDARRMEFAARRAVLLDDKLPAGHHMLGLLFKGIKWDFAKAELAYRRALQLNPENAYAVVEYADLLWETGRAGEAAEEIRKARALLPSLPVLAVKEAELQLDMGRPDAALVTARSAIELKRTYLRAYIAAGMAYEVKGDFESALAQYQHVLEVNPSDRRALPAYGYLLARTGDTGRAREVLSQLEKLNATVRNVAFQIAVVNAGLGKDDFALDWLEKAWRTRQAHFPFATVEYRFRRFHQNTRFRELLNRIGLKPFSS
jgi:tetratricopeptide (TPR) repeat protein